MLRKNERRDDKGDCIDCRRCVAVCPTGIDIRQGLQMECVNCTACMDACDEIMDKINKPRELIGYTSIAALEGRKRRFVRFRTMAYLTILIGLWSIGGYLLLTKPELNIQMLRPRGAGFAEIQQTVQNHFEARASNKSDKTWVLVPRAPEGYEVVTAFNPWTIEPQTTAVNQVFIRKARKDFSPDGKETLKLSFLHEGQLVFDTQITLLGPEQ